MSEIDNAIKSLEAIVTSANKAIESVQALCLHEKYRPVWWMWGPGRFDVVRRCEACHKHLDGITDDEKKVLGPLFDADPVSWRTDP